MNEDRLKQTDKMPRQRWRNPKRQEFKQNECIKETGEGSSSRKIQGPEARKKPKGRSDHSYECHAAQH